MGKGSKPFFSRLVGYLIPVAAGRSHGVTLDRILHGALVEARYEGY